MANEGRHGKKFHFFFRRESHNNWIPTGNFLPASLSSEEPAWEADAGAQFRLAVESDGFFTRFLSLPKDFLSFSSVQGHASRWWDGN